MERKTEDMYEKVKAYIDEHQMIAEGDLIVTGVSGGADSVCLLHLLWRLSRERLFRILVVHVHHGIRTDADQDAAYVQQLCREWEIPFLLKKVDMEQYARQNGLSPEEAGRWLRYRAFEEALGDVGGNGKVAVAHNRNDRAETMLFSLFRGSGLRGLGSIRPTRERIIRPILCLDREEIETYLKTEKIGFCIDSTNDDDTYTRNRIRHHIFPYVETQICRNAVEHMNHTADILEETDAFVQRQTDLAYERCRIGEDGETGVILDLQAMRAEEPFLQKAVVLRCMEHVIPHRKDITGEHIRAIGELIGKEGNKELHLPYGVTAYKEYEKLTIGKRREAATACPSFAVSVPGELTVPHLGTFSFQILEKEGFFYKNGQIIPEKSYTKWFDYDKITRVLLLRTRQTGDYLTIDDTCRKKTVKEYMINEKIPKMQRDCMYLLADGEHILWIPGYRISQYYKVDENTKCILQVQLRGGE